MSVVIPCFNYGRFLGEAIESALAQSYQPVEIVVVDDGSTDSTAEVARRYPVHLIQQANAGVCAAANRGVRASHGEYVLRLDADDALAPTYVEETHAILASHPDVAFVYTAVEYFGAATGTYPIEPYRPDTLAERNYVHCSALMRRRAFDLVGGYSASMGSARYEDWDLWLAFAERGLNGFMLPERLLRYRQHTAGSRGRLRLDSPGALLHEARMAARLQDNHPTLYGARAVWRRLRRVPGRLARGEVSPRYAALLVGVSAVMLARAALGVARAAPAQSRRGDRTHASPP